jgi:hypothetical protein
MKVYKIFAIFFSVIFLLIGVQVFSSNASYSKGVSISDRVEVRLYNVDDFASLYVNGVKFISTKYSTDTGRIEVDQYLTKGINTLRFITHNNGGIKPDNPMSYGYQAWVNGEMLLNSKCGQIGVGGCEDNRNFPGGKVYEKVLKININRASGQNHSVNIKSAVKGGIYLNGEFTGKSSPSTLILPTGDYRIGLGGVNNRYQELMTKVSSDQSVIFNDKYWLPAKKWKILLLAIREAHLGNGTGGNQVARLTDVDIKEAYDDLIEVDNRWVQPFSYGLVSWDVSRLIVENIRASITDQGDHINQDLFLQKAKLTSLKDKYDAITFFWPRIPNTNDPWNAAGAIGGGGSMSIPNTWIRGVKKFPREVWLHEWLHIVEGVNNNHGFFNGQNGLHGAEGHGYIGGTEGEWLDWYRNFMRGAVKEDGLFVGIPPSSWLSGSRTKQE